MPRRPSVLATPAAAAATTPPEALCRPLAAEGSEAGRTLHAICLDGALAALAAPTADDRAIAETRKPRPQGEDLAACDLDAGPPGDPRCLARNGPIAADK